MTNADVVQMAKAALSDDIIVAKIKSSPCKFDTSPTALEELKKSGLSDRVILAMVEPPPNPVPSTTPSVAPPAAAAVPPEKATVVFYHPPHGLMDAKFRVYIDGNQTCDVGGGRYCARKVDVGKHTFGFQFSRLMTMQIDVAAGQTYYFRMTLSGLFIPTANVNQVTNSQQALHDLRNMSPVDGQVIDVRPPVH
ncbi:MAG: hypothetical protein JO314_09380 [Acidobacteria bacterium]|nr:hypothetical protein [Acidobacteriota bacterium]